MSLVLGVLVWKNAKKCFVLDSCYKTDKGRSTCESFTYKYVNITNEYVNFEIIYIHTLLLEGDGVQVSKHFATQTKSAMNWTTS